MKVYTLDYGTAPTWMRNAHLNIDGRLNSDVCLTPKQVLAKAVYNCNALAYHNWGHVKEMLNLIPHEFMFAEGYDDLVNAIIWHDAVYVPGSTENEKKSYELFETLVGRKGPMIESLIMVTATHWVHPEHSHILELNPRYMCYHELIVDLDLYNLGGTWQEYITIGRKIRQEYKAFDDEQFMEGRLKFLEKFMGHKVYQTPFFSPREASAQNNMAKEYYIIKNLGKLPSYEG